MELVRPAVLTVYRLIRAAYDPKEGGRKGRRRRFLNRVLSTAEHHQLREAITAAGLILNVTLINRAVKCMGKRETARK